MKKCSAIIRLSVRQLGLVVEHFYLFTFLPFYFFTFLPFHHSHP